MSERTDSYSVGCPRCHGVYARHLGRCPCGEGKDYLEYSRESLAMGMSMRDRDIETLRNEVTLLKARLYDVEHRQEP